MSDLPPMGPPPAGPYAPAPQPAGNDKTTLWGVLGIIFSFCCFPLGIVFAILSLLEAKKVGKQPTLAYVAFGVVVLGIIIDLVYFVAARR